MRNFTLKLAAAALTFGAWATTAVPASAEDAIIAVDDAVSDLSTVEGKTVLLVNISSATNKGYAYVTSGHSCDPTSFTGTSPFAGSERVATSGSADMPAVGSTDLSCVFILVKNDDDTYSFQVYNDNTKWLSGDNQAVKTAGTPVHVSDETGKAKVNMTTVNGTTWRVVNTSTTTNRIYLNVGAADKGGLVWYNTSDANTVFNIRPVTVGEATAIITFQYKDELGDAISSSTTTVLSTSENYTIPAAPDIDGYTNGTADQQTIASPSGNYTVTYTYEIANEETAVEGYTDLRTNIEKGLGYVTGYSKADYDASNMATATTADEFRTAYAQLKGKEIAIEEGRYYRMTCCQRNYTIGISGTNAVGQTLDRTSVDQLWLFETVDGGYRVRSANSGKYFGTNFNPLSLVDDASSAGTVTVNTAENVNAPGYTNIKYDGTMIHGAEGGKLILYNSIGGLQTGSAWRIVPATDLDVTLNAVESESKSYATVHLPFATNTTGDVKAYYATAKDDANVTMTETTDGIAANQGALLVSESGATTATLTIADGVAEPTTDNLLKGTNVALSDITAADYYIFGNGDAGVGFYHPNATTLKANRAYIEAGTTAAASLKLSFGQTTGIESIVTPDAAAAPLYDLQGRRVVKAAKGIYIQGGKKVYVK